MIPKIIHQTAARPPLSWEERRLARRMQKMLPGWTYKLRYDRDNSALIQRVFPQYAEPFERLPRGVMRADVARYAFLYADGGFYFDTDYKLLRPIGPELLQESCIIPLEHDAGALPPSGDGTEALPKLGNAVLASVAGHPLWRDFIADIFEGMASRPDASEQEVLDATGPDAITRFVHANRERYPDLVTPRSNLFHPKLSAFAMRTSADSQTYGAHLCWGSWRGRPPLVAARKLLRRKVNAL